MSKNYLFDTTNYQDRGGQADPPSGDYVTQEEFEAQVSSLQNDIGDVSNRVTVAQGQITDLGTEVGDLDDITHLIPAQKPDVCTAIDNVAADSQDLRNTVANGAVGTQPALFEGTTVWDNIKILNNGESDLTVSVNNLSELIGSLSDMTNVASAYKTPIAAAINWTAGRVGDLSSISIPASNRASAASAIEYNRRSIDENTDAISAIEQSVGVPSSASETMDVWQAIEDLRTRVAALEGNT